jgi:hypothetical protein
VPTIDEESDRLCAYVSSLGDFKMVKAEGWAHMGATIVETVLRSGLDYDHVVKPRVEPIRRNRDAATTSGFLRLLGRKGVENLVNLNHRKRDSIVEAAMTKAAANTMAVVLLLAFIVQLPLTMRQMVILFDCNCR